MGDGAPVELDSLGAAELAAVAEEVASVLRHDLRNKLAAIRNASFYIRRRLAKTETWSADPRLEELSGVIQREANAANELLDERLGLGHLFARAVARTDARECVRQAIASARIQQGPALRVDLEAGTGEVDADSTELALAIRCLLENACRCCGTSKATGWHTAEVNGTGKDWRSWQRCLKRRPPIDKTESMS